MHCAARGLGLGMSTSSDEAVELLAAKTASQRDAGNNDSFLVWRVDWGSISKKSGC